MGVQVFDRGNPQRNRTQLKWFDQLRQDHLRLTPGIPGAPLVGKDPQQTAKRRLAAGIHEVTHPERGLPQPCKNCRRASRESTWVARCGPCGELFSPVLWLTTACEWCGGPEGAMARLEEHVARIHQPARSA